MTINFQLNSNISHICMYNNLESSQLYISLFTLLSCEDIEESEVKPTPNSILSITHAYSNIRLLCTFEARTNLKSSSPNPLRIDRSVGHLKNYRKIQRNLYLKQF